jgi:hypothetical protein
MVVGDEGMSMDTGVSKMLVLMASKPSSSTWRKREINLIPKPLNAMVTALRFAKSPVLLG